MDPSGLASVNLANPQTLNPYTYAIDNPVNYVDPTGLSYWSDVHHGYQSNVHQDVVFGMITGAVGGAWQLGKIGFEVGGPDGAVAGAVIGAIAGMGAGALTGAAGAWVHSMVWNLGKL